MTVVGISKQGALCAMAFGVGVLAALAVPASAGLDAVSLTNDSADTFCTLYISPRGRDLWSERTLGPGCLRPGQSLTVQFSDDTVKQWDLRFRDGNGNYRDVPPFDTRVVRTLILRNNGQVETR